MAGELSKLRAEHFANLKAGATVVFSGKVVWKVQAVVDRGAVLVRADNGSHEHLAEWHELAAAMIECP